MNTQIHQFIALLKENNQLLGKITTDVNGWNTEQQQTTSQEEKMTQLVESLIAYQGRVAEGLRRQECILEEMEKLVLAIWNSRIVPVIWNRAYPI